MGNVLPPSFHSIRNHHHQQQHHNYEQQMDMYNEDKETQVLLSSGKEKAFGYVTNKKSTLLKGDTQKEALRVHSAMSSKEKKTFMDATICDENDNPLIFNTTTPNTIGLDKNTAAQLYQICVIERILERTGFN